MTNREAEMVARSEAGESVDQIAAAMGLKPGYVDSTIKFYNSGMDDHARWRRAAAASDAAFRDAIARISGSFA